MPVYLFVWPLFAWSVTAVVLFPLMFPWSVVAYKIWHGFKEIEEDMGEELWARAWRVNGVLFFASPLFVLLDFVAADWFDLPAGWIHIVFLALFLSFAAWMMMYFFSMEDFFQGLMLATIHVYVPATLLFLLSLVIRWNPLFDYVLSWLKEPKP